MIDMALRISGGKVLINGAETINYTYGKNKIGSLSQKESQFKWGYSQN